MIGGGIILNSTSLHNMDRSDQIKIAEKPEDLRGTPLERREFMSMLKAGGALALGSSLAGCAGGGGDSNSDVPEELVIARPSDADLLDPHQTTDANASRVMSLLYDGMILMDGDRNFQEMLGKGFEVSDDGTEWTIEFNVDSGITFHNGDEFTVDDVVFTFERFLEKSLIRSWAAGSMQGVEKVDDRRVKFSFEEPYAFFDSHAAAISYFGILPEDLGGKSDEEFAQEPIGTGPYELEEWVKGERITLARNDDWKTPTYDVVESNDPPVPEKIVWQVIPEATPRVQGLLSGEVDALMGVPPRKRENINSSEEATLHSNTGGSIYYVPMHNELEPTNDVTVRKAIAHAIDKERIVSDIYNNAGSINYSPMPASYPSWAGETVREEVGYEYDLDRAREFLSEAGWEESGGDYREKDGETLELSMITPNAPPATLQSSEEIAAMLGEVGINVGLTTTQPNTAYTEMAKGETHLMFASLSWFTADVMQFMLSSALAGASNLQFLKDDQVDQYLNEAARTLDDEKRANIYEQMQLRVMELCATVPLMTLAEETAVRSEFTGYDYLEGAASSIWLDMRLEDE